MEFVFEIGDFVRLMISAEQTQLTGLWSGKGAAAHDELRGQIISRFYEECPGGIQRHYSVRWTTSKGHPYDDLFRHNEIELVVSEPFSPNIPDEKKDGD